MQTRKRTKIVATLGPASNDLATIQQLIEAGVSVFRMNFSHGTAADHQQRATLIRQAATALKQEVAIMADLQGPKIRIARFKNKQVTLHVGQSFILDADFANDAGDEQQVGIDYKNLPQDVTIGDKLLLDDGRLVFVVEKVAVNKVFCIVEVGGILSNNKGINKLGGGLTAEALTEKDKEDMKTAIKIDVDYIAISFPRNAQDMHHARELMQSWGGNADLVAKIERAEAMDVLDDIIRASDAVMVARGDLGVEIGDASLPAAQKLIIQRARILDKAVITATQMMESMIENSIPTRAEVFDVANAVIDYTDAVMLSAETASGKHPVEVVKAMVRICIGAEQDPTTQVSKHRVECEFQNTSETIAMAAMYAANHYDIKAIVALTESGATPLLMSRIKTGIPIYAFSSSVKTLRKVCLYRDVYPVSFSLQNIDNNNVYDHVVTVLQQNKLINRGEKIIITCGDLVGVHGATNGMKIITIT
ncbi:MAG: pyruvate kinase [Gammaproteobacteria bacterium]|nr:pyruvate kinase [Gammaproteobacteria bacterium]